MLSSARRWASQLPTTPPERSSCSVPTSVGPVPFAHPAHMFTWPRSAERPIRTKIDPAPNNPGGFSFAYDGALRAMVAFGGDGGELTNSGAWVSGGNQTWVLTHVG